MKKKNGKENIGVEGKFTLTFRNKDTKKITKKVVIKNKVVSTGLNALVKSMLSTETRPVMTHIAIGDGNATVSLSDTALDNEVFRQAIRSEDSNLNSFFLSIYVSHTEFEGDVKEMAVIIDGTDTAGSGILFNRIGEESSEFPLNKSGLETLTVDYQLTINNI